MQALHYTMRLWLNTEKKSHFDLKIWIAGGTKTKTPSNWKIYESNWLDIESQIDSILRVKLTRNWESYWLEIESQIDSKLRVKLTIWFSILNQFTSNILQSLGIRGRILSPLVTQLFRSKWLYFSFSEIVLWIELMHSFPSLSSLGSNNRGLAKLFESMKSYFTSHTDLKEVSTQEIGCIHHVWKIKIHPRNLDYIWFV